MTARPNQATQLPAFACHTGCSLTHRPTGSWRAMLRRQMILFSFHTPLCEMGCQIWNCAEDLSKGSAQASIQGLHS